MLLVTALRHLRQHVRRVMKLVAESARIHTDIQLVFKEIFTNQARMVFVS